MGSFVTTNGLIHFVFGDPQDGYLQKSLIRLNFQDMLYLTLRKQKYRGIYFCTGTEEQITVSALDSDSWQLYEKHQPKGPFLDHLSKFLTGGMSCAASAAYKRTSATDLAASFCQQLCQMLRSEGRVAFVFPISLFCRLFSGKQQRFLPELCGLDAQSAQKGNSLFLYGPIRSSGSQTFLLDPDGPFQTSPLCPQLWDLARRADRVPLYEHLQKKLGDRCLFLNQFSQEILQLHLRYVVLVARPERLCPPELLDRMADLLYLWYHSQAFRLASGPVLSSNRYRNFSLLLQDLLDSTNWHTLQQQARKLLSQSPAQLRERYPFDSAQPLIPADDLIAQKLQYITVSPALSPDGKLLERFLSVRSEVETPGNHLLPQELFEMSKTFVDSMDTAANEQDRKTFTWGLTALQFCRSRTYLSLSDQLEICKSYRAILELSRRTFQLEQMMDQEYQSIDRFTRERDSAMDQLNQLKRVMGVAIWREEDFTAHPNLRLLAERACRLNNQIKNRQKTYATKQSQREQFDDLIWQFETAISHLTIGHTLQLSDTLRNAMDHIRQNAKTAQQLDWSIQELDDQFEYLSHAAPDASAHLAEEYEMMCAASQQ